MATAYHVTNLATTAVIAFSHACPRGGVPELPDQPKLWLRRRCNAPGLPDRKDRHFFSEIPLHRTETLVNSDLSLDESRS
jgi:hypothetical protein